VFNALLSSQAQPQQIEVDEMQQSASQQQQQLADALMQQLGGNEVNQGLEAMYAANKAAGMKDKEAGGGALITPRGFE
jgi:hypothetical protein